MIFDAKSLSSDAFYGLMLQAIVPRPIAWILSRNPGGTYNVAPFSFFNGVSSEPPILMVSVGRRDDGSKKDTLVNIEAGGDFVVHVPSVEQATAMVATSKPLPPGESELEDANLLTVDVPGTSLPRIEGPKIALFCRRHKIVEVGTEPMALVLGEVTHIWADDSVVSSLAGRTLLDPKKIDPLARLGLADYAGLGEIRRIKRPA